jgi:hypothetical protein
LKSGLKQRDAEAKTKIWLPGPDSNQRPAH